MNYVTLRLTNRPTGRHQTHPEVHLLVQCRGSLITQRDALLPKSANVRFDVVEASKRPVMADADSISIDDIEWVEIRSEPSIQHRILFDPGHGLEERLISEQFT